MPRQKRKSDCPINFALEIFGDRWTLLIIRDLMFKGKNYYSEFLQSEEKIATNILADRLAMLEQEGIVIKKVDPAHGSKFIYNLSEKGIDLLPVLSEIVVWSAKYDGNEEAIQFANGFMKGRENMLDEISNRLKTNLAE